MHGVCPKHGSYRASHWAPPHPVDSYFKGAVAVSPDRLMGMPSQNVAVAQLRLYAAWGTAADPLVLPVLGTVTLTQPWAGRQPDIYGNDSRAQPGVAVSAAVSILMCLMCHHHSNPWYCTHQATETFRVMWLLHSTSRTSHARVEEHSLEHVLLLALANGRMRWVAGVNTADMHATNRRCHHRHAGWQGGMCRQRNGLAAAPSMHQ